MVFLLIISSCQNDFSEVTKCNVSIDNGLGYVDGKKYSGRCNIFYNDSLLWKTRTYKDGLQTQEISYYLFEGQGQVEYIGNSKNGHIHGDFISYYTNGQVSIKGKLSKGYYIGEWNYWDDDGSLNKTLIYNKKGEKIDSIGHK